MNHFSERLRQLRTERGLSQERLSAVVGVSKSSINMYERGEREPGFDTIAVIAEFFNVDMDYLMGKSEYKNKDEWLQAINRSLSFEEGGAPFLREELMPLEFKRFPLVGEIACGEPIFTIEEQDCYIEAGGQLKADFCLRARGDSMIGARIMDGDLVFIRRQPVVENGEIAAVVIDDTATLKRVYYYPKEGKLALNAENPHYPPLIYVGEELNHIRILGKAVAFQSVIR